MGSKMSFRLLAIAALVALALPLGVTMPGVSGDGDDRQYTIPTKVPLKYPNLDSMLNQLVARYESGQASAEEAAVDSPLHLGGMVAVTFYLSGNVDGVASYLKANGGDPRNMGEDYIEAYVPVGALGAASEQAGVLRVQAIAPPHADGAGPSLGGKAVPLGLSDAGSAPALATESDATKEDCPIED